jgi:hypothetical protein
MSEQETKFYQAVDADGNAIGLPIEYTDDKDLRSKLNSATQSMRLTLSKGKITAIKAPETAPKFTPAASEDEQARQVKEAVAQFLRTTPAYHVDPYNMNALVQWIDDNDLQPNLANFRLAFQTLSKAGLLIDERGSATTSDDPSGVSYTDPRSGQTYYGKKAIEAMSADEYKRRLNSQSGFAERVDKLLSGK